VEQGVLACKPGKHVLAGSSQSAHTAQVVQTRRTLLRVRRGWLCSSRCTGASQFPKALSEWLPQVEKMCAAARVRVMAHLDTEQPRTAASRRWASLVARLLALLLLCSTTCAAAATGDAAVRPCSHLPHTGLAWLSPWRPLNHCDQLGDLHLLCRRGNGCPGRAASTVIGSHAPGSCAGFGPGRGAATLALRVPGGSRTACASRDRQGPGSRVSAGHRAGWWRRSGRRQRRAGSGARELQPHQRRRCAAQRPGLLRQHGGPAAGGQLVRILDGVSVHTCLFCAVSGKSVYVCAELSWCARSKAHGYDDFRLTLHSRSLPRAH